MSRIVTIHLEARVEGFVRAMKSVARAARKADRSIRRTIVAVNRRKPLMHNGRKPR